jgi:pimeloyl-ACP methyl ester carboxylesterase
LTAPAAVPAARVEGHGPAVLLLHGQPGSGADWHGVADLLRDRHTVVVPDRPGYGRTGGRAVGFSGNARAALALLDSHGIESAAVAGHSWGAGVALDMAIEAPERVRSLALIAPVTPLDRLGVIDRLLADPRIGPRAAYAAMRALGFALERSPLRRRLSALLPGYGSDRAQDLAREWRDGRAWRSFYVEQRALVDELPGLRPRIGAVRARTTIVVADRDRVADPANARELAAAIGARVVEIPGAGHLLPMREPERVAAAIG